MHTDAPFDISSKGSSQQPPPTPKHVNDEATHGNGFSNSWPFEFSQLKAQTSQSKEIYPRYALIELPIQKIWGYKKMFVVLNHFVWNKSLHSNSKFWLNPSVSSSNWGLEPYF